MKLFTRVQELVRTILGNITSKNKTRPLAIAFLFLLFLIITFFDALAVIDTQSADFTELKITGGTAQNTLFLPLKINAPDGVDQLTELTDRSLTEILTSKELQMIPREYAMEKLDYQKSWPPSLEDIKLFHPPTGIEYVAVGALTRLGGKISIDIIVHDLTQQEAPGYYYGSGDSINDTSKALQKVVGDILSHTGRYFQIATIDIKGNERIDAGAILRDVTLKAGDRYNQNKLRDDLKKIFKMGYFNDVQVDVEDTGKGKKITFIVKEKDAIGVVAIANNDKIKEDDIREVITIHPNSIISPTQVRRSIENIKNLYKEKGFYDTKVEASLTNPKPGRVDVRFAITEGVKVFIKEVRFAGNNSFKSKQLNKIIETSEKGFFSWITDSGVLKKEIVEQDAARINSFYNNNGFIDAKVGAPEIKQDGEWLYVTFNIAEGDRYRVGTVDLTGDLIEEKAVLLGKIATVTGNYFSSNTLRQDVMTLTDFYAEKGFAFAEVKPAFGKTTDDKTVNVSIAIQKKDLVYVNRIIIKGNTRTRDKVIRREILVKEKEIFDATALKKSHAELQKLQYFEDVSITPEPTLDENLMDIIVDLKEKPTGTFSIGAGYSSVDSFMFMGEISQDNFMGRGQSLALQANLSGTSTQYNLKFTEPHLNDTKLLFGIDLYDWEKEYDDYTKDSQGFSFRFAYPVWKKWTAHWSYGFDTTSLNEIDFNNVSTVILDSRDIEDTSYVTLGAVRDTTDRRFDPSTGALHSISTKYAGGPVLGGDSFFTKVQGSSNLYYPFFMSTTLHLKGAMGYVTENSGGKLPVYEKFYLGGISSIRGFKSNHISPKDSLTGDRIGGLSMWYYNSELIFPLVKEAGLKGVVFLDAGNVYEDSTRWDFNTVKKSAGLGFRWISPMGPLRLEWGYNLDPVGDEDQDNWDFSIGGSF